MPKMAGRKTTRPMLREINLELCIDARWYVSSKWGRPQPCSLEGCGHRPDVGEMAYSVAYEDAVQRAAAGLLDYGKVVWYTLCEEHGDRLYWLWDEAVRDAEVINDVG